MSSKAMSLKARIRNYAKDKHIAAQVVLQKHISVDDDRSGTPDVYSVFISYIISHRDTKAAALLL